MPKILYSQVIEEDPEELKELEKYHRYTHLFQRVRMLLGSLSRGNAPTWQRQLRLWATLGASARGGSPPTNKVVCRSCSKAGWKNAVARSWLPPKPSKNSRRP